LEKNGPVNKKPSEKNDKMLTPYLTSSLGFNFKLQQQEQDSRITEVLIIVQEMERK